MRDTTNTHDNEITSESVGWNRVELTAAILVCTAEILTAFAAYRSSLAGGSALQGHTKSSRTAANTNGSINVSSSIHCAHKALSIDAQGDNFDLADVYFAVSLIFAGIAAPFQVRSLQTALLIGSVVMLLPGLWEISQSRDWL